MTAPNPGHGAEWSDHHDGEGDCTSCGRRTTLRSDQSSGSGAPGPRAQANETETEES